MKRFYKDVAVSPDNTILLDGKPIKTPARHLLQLPTRALADAVADEWRAQKTEIDSDAMPLTKFANTAIDRVEAMRGEVIDQILAFGDSDLLCYRADFPPQLAERQNTEWQPLLDWAASRFGLTLNLATGIVHVLQPPEALAGARAYLESQSNFALAVAHAMSGILGSLVLTLAVRDGYLDEAQAFALSRLDEEFQAEQWGRDAEAEVRVANYASELGAAALFLRLSNP